MIRSHHAREFRSGRSLGGFAKDEEGTTVRARLVVSFVRTRFSFRDNVKPVCKTTDYHADIETEEPSFR